MTLVLFPHFSQQRRTAKNALLSLELYHTTKKDKFNALFVESTTMSSSSTVDRFRSYYKENNLYINLHQPFEHSLRLASIIQMLLDGEPPIKVMMTALASAKCFVHFTTFGISHQMHGILKMTSYSVPVRGIVSLGHDQQSISSELIDHPEESPNLSIKVVKGNSKNWAELPHQKLIVIDGLIAFKGSVNLTQTAWRKSAYFYDALEVVTDIEKVIQLHNNYFSTVWAKLSDCGSVITIN
ncbi:phospholipase D-like domain-containing protein [Pseudanabaena sp. UWO310]|uniref:phospholipase D-like domain-containing protein n=1 Tax=Pseudanabaena sp. UWO310 TaxID=2480795 RepID=UPI00115A7013|nr:phospholipase D-like domain-containing protein [Pseudanabaena sp. UWO310]TYQ26089.1 hypothetical protein PseudUWO310_17965 [Pseudanabaena sp. UWO310]